MIDMVFLLLVFFMTVSTLARDARPDTDLAVSITARVAETAPPRDVITVFGNPEGYRYFWHNREVPLDRLGKLLEEASGQLLLRGAPGLPYEAWANLLPLIRKSGISQVVFATYEA